MEVASFSVRVQEAVRPADERGRSVLSQLQRTGLFRGYQEAFETTTGLPLVLRQPGSFQSPLHGSKRLNPFCGLMARHNHSCAACLQLQQRTEDEAATEPKTLECAVGLSESAVPVRTGDHLVGYLQTGQIFLQPPTKTRLKEGLKQIGSTPTAPEMKELEEAYVQTRVMLPKQYESIVRLLAIFAQQLAAISHQVLTQAAAAEMPSITKIRTFIAEHQSEELHLHDVAHAAHMSEFYFCKMFKRATGSTFTDYLARLRIETVKQKMFNAQTRVSEAAYAAGFQSLSQFNRVFRRIAGEAPTEFRERLHGGNGAPLRGHA
jgi:AraC-like DNA-binding protein/ligand-binding sensor protein